MLFFKPIVKADKSGKLLFVEIETVIVLSDVSLPVTTNGVENKPVTTHDPAGIGEVDANGLGTVVAPAGACPLMTGGRNPGKG